MNQDQISLSVNDYIKECILLKKKLSGKKLKSFETPYNIEEIYSKLYPDEGACIVCNSKVKFKNIKIGYGNTKYCSVSCKNKSENKKINNRISKKRNHHYISLIKNYDIQSIYDKNELTLEQISEKYCIPLSRLRKHLNLSDNRGSILSSKKLNNKFKNINNYLDSYEYDGRTSEEISNELNCSKNYVSSYLRNVGKNLPYQSSVSSIERKIRNFLDSLNIQYICNDRKIISPLELDIFIPDFKLAIEINGIYWHSKKDKNYHSDKRKLCKNIGIRCIQFTNVDIIHNENICYSIIKSALNMTNKIGARKTKIIIPTNDEYLIFCKENHIQGPVNGSIKYALTYKNEIMSCMSFSKSRFNKNYQYELLRYCNKRNWTIVGGPNKLLKHFENKVKPKSLISYCNLSYFTGDMYHILGMKHIKNSCPNYIWVNSNGHYVNRYDTQTHKLKAPESKTMKLNGYHKYYDCGSGVFSKKY